MANLSVKEISNRPDKPESAKTFIKKILQEDGFGGDFKGVGGLFCSHFIEVIYDDNTKKIYKRTASKAKNLKLINEYINKGENVKSISVVGKFAGKTSDTKIKVSKLVKTEEFGGQPSSGKKINLGIKFEKDLFSKMYDCLEGVKCDGSYAKAADYIIKESSSKIKSPASKFLDTGGKNTSRPITASSSSVYIKPSSHSQHGALLSDIDIEHDNGEKSHLSLKYGSTLTFMNAGVQKILKESEIKTGVISNASGKSLLSALGIDEKMFCDVFNKYGEQNFSSVSSTPNMSLLKKLLSTGIGSDYWMVHGQPGGAVHFWYMDPKNNTKYSTPTGSYVVYYGGKSGRGKRIDIEFGNAYFDFKLNIRNKQRGLYPSHIMLDYTSKDAIGKTKIK